MDRKAALLVRRGIAGTVTKVNMASYAKGVYVLHIRLDGKNTSWKVFYVNSFS